MIITCTKCKKKYDIPDERLKAFGKSFTLPCASCKHRIIVNLEKKEDKIKEKPKETGLLSGDKLKKKILESVNDLPPMPQVAQKARQIVSDPDSDFGDLAKVIETDPAIVTKILKIANSSYYGAVGRVASVQQAAVVLGAKTLQELLTLACAAGLLSKELKGYQLSSGDLWSHSLATAAACRVIAKRDHPALAEDAFSAGLIHDAGKLILDQYILERIDVFQQKLGDKNLSFLSAEKEVLGFDHAEIASDVCEKWQIPKHLSLAIKYHHHPSNSNDNGLAYILHIADSIALMCGLGEGIDGMKYEMDVKALEFLKLKDTDVQMIMGEVIEYIEQTTQSQ